MAIRNRGPQRSSIDFKTLTVRSQCPAMDCTFSAMLPCPAREGTSTYPMAQQIPLASVRSCLFRWGRFFALTGRVYQHSRDLVGHQETIDWLLGLMRREHWMKPVGAGTVHRRVDRF